MLSRKNNDKVGQKSHVKEQDPLYYGLLKLACVTDHTHYTFVVLEQSVIILDSLPDYISVHQRIIPLLNAKTRQLGVFEKLSERTKQLLILCTQQGVISELDKSKQLEQILDVLMTQHIPVILLKGVAFNNVLYNSDAPKTSNDIDLLVKKAHWPQVLSAVKTIMDPLIKNKKAVFDDLYESSFVPKSQVGAALDLHMSLVHPFFTDANVRMLSAEHALIHQAIHAFKDTDFCKYNLFDSHEIINSLKRDLTLTVKIAKAWGVSVACYYSLQNCADIMGTKVGGHLLSNVQPSHLRQYMAGKLLASKFAQPTTTAKPTRYRINQVLSQFVFTGSFLRTLKFQWLFITSAMKKKSALLSTGNK